MPPDIVSVSLLILAVAVDDPDGPSAEIFLNIACDEPLSMFVYVTV